ncbi:MAG: hypothetical protein CMF55_06305 [Legionellales bacterium]|nr:hypothetical protein [Legionellales bacterium]HAG62348.1 hypothetical protein [Coxiellaceae bacterium]
MLQQFTHTKYFRIISLCLACLSIFYFSQANATNKIFYKCRIAINPYLDEAQCKKPYTDACSQRTRIVTFAPSSTTSDYNDRRSTVIIDKLAKKAYLIDLTAQNTLKLKPTKMYITGSSTIRSYCTIKASPQYADPGYYEFMKSQGKNSKIRQKRILRIRPSIFKSFNNNKHTTSLIDITGRKIYFFWIDKENEMHLHRLTLKDLKYLANPYLKKGLSILDKDLEKQETDKNAIKGSSAGQIKALEKKIKEEYQTYFKVNKQSNYQFKD